MTRAKILAEYTVKDGVIQNPGKFEFEPIYTPHYWSLMLDGLEYESIDFPIGEDETKTVDIFQVTAEDLAEFPELEGIAYIALEVSEEGFVQASELVEGDLEGLRKISEKEWARYEDGEEFDSSEDEKK